jgi:hypothetical protein
MLLMLLGTPVSFVLTATAGMSVESRRRSRAALHLMGIPRRTLAAAAFADGLFAGLAGWFVGIVMAAIGATLLSDTRTFGFSWYPARLGVSTLTITATLLVPVALGLMARRAVRGELADPVQTQAGGPVRRRPWKLIPLALGVAIMAGLLLQAFTGGTRLSGGAAFGWFVTGLVLAVMGLSVGSEELVRGAALWFHRDDHATNRHLALRGLAWRAGSVARTVAGAAAVAIIGLLGSGVIADLEALSTPGPQGDEWTISLTGTNLSQAAAALGVEGAPRIGEVFHNETSVYVGSCDELAVLLDSHHSSRAVLGPECSTNTTSRNNTSSSSWDGRFRIGDPASLLGTTENAEIVAYPGDSPKRVDDYLTAVVRADPGVTVTNTSAATFKPSIAPTARLFKGCVVIGSLVAFILVALTAIDSFGERQTAIGRLRTLGVPGALVALADASALAIGAGVLILTANAVGWMAGSSYDFVAASGSSPGLPGLLVTGCSVASAAVTVLAATAAMLRTLARRSPWLARTE